MSVNDLHQDIPSMDSLLVVNEFQDVFPNDLPGVPSTRAIDFGIDLEPDTKPILVPPYRMAPAEHKELKLQLKISLIRVSFRQAYPLGALQCFF